MATQQNPAGFKVYESKRTQELGTPLLTVSPDKRGGWKLHRWDGGMDFFKSYREVGEFLRRHYKGAIIERKRNGKPYAARRGAARSNPYHVYVDHRLSRSFDDLDAAQLYYQNMMRGPAGHVALLETKPGQMAPLMRNPSGFVRCVEESARGGCKSKRARGNPLAEGSRISWTVIERGKRKTYSGVVVGYGRYGKPWNVYKVEVDGGGIQYIHADRLNPKRNPRNPLDASDAAYQEFHGEGPEGTTTIEWQEHFHTHVWAVGDLVKMYVLLPKSRRQPGLGNIVEIAFDYERPKEKRTFLDANEKGTQMFIDGGDQRVNVLDFGIENHLEAVVLGYLKRIDYYTTKKHLGKEGGTAVYKHIMGEEGGELPTVVYHTIDKKLAVVGGSYTMPTEGIRN
jgi:hypothetical protein